MENSNHFNVIVIGAGISGIGAGYYLKKNCPNKSFCIIEGRENIGGTWDLFKYPGNKIRLRYVHTRVCI